MLFIASILNFKIIEIKITHFKCRMICAHGSVSTVWHSTNVQRKCDFIFLVPAWGAKEQMSRVQVLELFSPFYVTPQGVFLHVRHYVWLFSVHVGILY